MRAAGGVLLLSASLCAANEDAAAAEMAALGVDEYDGFSYGFELTDMFDTAEMCAYDCVSNSPIQNFTNDGECDEACNVPECGWDGSDCFHGHGECFTHGDASDYRGSVNQTASGLLCQMWSHQWPWQHEKVFFNYPAAGLGGHNSCRNPDGEATAWCFTLDPDTRWELCNVGEPSTTSCGKATARLPPPPPPASVIRLTLNEMATYEVDEHRFAFFSVDLPAKADFVKTVVVPQIGDPGTPKNNPSQHPPSPEYKSRSSRQSRLRPYGRRATDRRPRYAGNTEQNPPLPQAPGTCTLRHSKARNLLSTSNFAGKSALAREVDKRGHRNRRQRVPSPNPQSDSTRTGASAALMI
jgi:hypothetical protein